MSDASDHSEGKPSALRSFGALLMTEHSTHRAAAVSSHMMGLHSIPSGAASTTLPSSASGEVLSNSHAGSHCSSRRRSWADVTDNSSDDQIWTPTSSSAPQAPLSSFPSASSLAPEDDRAEFDDMVSCGSATEKSLRTDLSDGFTGTSSAREGPGEIPTQKGRKGRKKAAAQDFPTPLDARLGSAAAANLLMDSDSSNVNQSLTSAERLADDMRFWQKEEASSTAASSSSERLADRDSVRPATWSVGAGLHADGLCHPCIFYPKAIGCDSGADCTFCHLDHDPRARHRRNMRRGRGKVNNSSESGEANAVKKADPEDVTFILPSSLRRTRADAWPIVFPGQPTNVTQSPASASADTHGRGVVLRKGGLRTSPCASSNSGASGNGDVASTKRIEEQNSEVASVFTSFLAPLFGGSSADGIASADPEVESNVTLEPSRGKGRRGIYD